MYAINPLTNECVYKTPCGWCVRSERECTQTKNFTEKVIKNCRYYDNDTCLRTKEVDPCKGTNCKHYKDKTLINDPAFQKVNMQLLLKSYNKFI